MVTHTSAIARPLKPSPKVVVHTNLTINGRMLASGPPIFLPLLGLLTWFKYPELQGHSTRN